MKSIALSAMFAGALLVPASFASGMATSAANPAAMPLATQELPQKVTRSGHDFLAHCNSEAFANARFPQKLAARCTRILSLWRAEADRKGNRMGTHGGGIDHFGAPRGIPPPPPVGR